MTPSMPVVYIAGKFRGPTAWAIAEHVREAERWGLRVAEAGAMPLIPHANTALFHGLLTEQFWIDGTLGLLARCDAALFMPGWTESTGAVGEHSYCERHGIPIFGVAHLKNGEFEAWVRANVAERAAVRVPERLRALSEATGCPEAIELAYALGRETASPAAARELAEWRGIAQDFVDLFDPLRAKVSPAVFRAIAVAVKGANASLRERVKGLELELGAHQEEARS